MNANTQIDEDTKLSDLLPIELCVAFENKKQFPKYIQSLEEKRTCLADLIEAYEIMGDLEMAEIKKQELKFLEGE
jgi:hypothetical protein